MGSRRVVMIWPKDNVCIAFWRMDDDYTKTGSLEKSAIQMYEHVKGENQEE
jgi:hypothetical protein